MTKKKIIEAELEARRFLKRVEEYKKFQVEDYFCRPSIYRSAIRRSSMDLTRALAKLRRHELE